jgi:hypothetical protein
MDKKVYVYNHAGTQLGTFTTRSAIKSNSVAVTKDGSLIVAVDESAVYGLSRSSFMPSGTTEETITGDIPETTGETIPLSPTTTRKVITKKSTLPTPYPPSSETAESPLSPAVPLMALLLLYFHRSEKK